MMKQIIKKINWEIALIVLIVAVGAFLRLYHIELFSFADDQARDANIAQGVLRGDLIIEGPQFSVDTGGSRGHLGPFYFYLIAPAFYLANGDPIGNVLLIAFLSIISIYLIYLVGKNYFDPTTGIISAIILTFSYYVLFYSRFPWNPNIMIFFVLLMLFFLYKAIKINEYYYLAVGLLLGLITQIQASTFIFFLCFPIFFFTKIAKWPKLRIILGAIVLGAITYTPIIIYDLNHKYLNAKAYLALALGRGSTPDYEPFGHFPFVYGFMDYFHEFFGVSVNKYFLFVLFLALFSAIVLALRDKIKNAKIIAIFSGVFLLMYGLISYKNKLEDYFFLTITPFVILLFGYLLGRLYNINKIGKLITVLILVLFVFFSERAYWADVQGKVNRTYAADYPSQILWKDETLAIDYMINNAKNYDPENTFSLDFQQTCIPTPFVNFSAIIYGFKLKNITLQNKESAKINYYIIQPPESRSCANLDTQTYNIIDERQFGKIIILTAVKK
jgi:4-amino-4-deoxy-L-arabinose transferase-like glycosyltransferase